MASSSVSAERPAEHGDAKGILRKDHHRKSSHGIVWDEPTIAEHDKERGTRTKINEPNTPYRPPLDPEGE
jgi:hypothetical protein